MLDVVNKRIKKRKMIIRSARFFPSVTEGQNDFSFLVILNKATLSVAK